MKSPDEATLAARASWTNRGTARPEFAIEPEHGQRSVWDFPRPPALQPTEHVIEVSLGGVVIAHSEAALELLETSHPPTYYVPRADVEMSYLAVAGGGGSHCEWKGKARYFDVIVGDTCLPRVAWSYEAPYEEQTALAGHIAFYAHDLACFVDGERATPQAGGFYGGWITSHVAGPFKGESGSSGW